MSEQPKWTPGPWTAEIQSNQYHDDLGWIVLHGNGRIGWASLAYTDTNREADKSDPARAANAHLIAAAPDLYTALEGLLALHESDDGAQDTPEVLAAVDAMLKARGQA